jgi:hypothetical protein
MLHAEDFVHRPRSLPDFGGWQSDCPVRSYVFILFLFDDGERLLRDADSFAIASESVLHNRIYKQYNKRSVRKPYETSLFRRALASSVQFFFRLRCRYQVNDGRKNYLRNNIS